MKKVMIAQMSRLEFARRKKQNPIIILPLGSLEQHGLACPMGDYILAEAVAKRIAEENDALCAPVLPFGHADYFQSVPGGIALRAETFKAILTDLCENYLMHDLNRILIINGHGGNKALILEVIRNLRKKWDVMIPCMSLWGNITDAAWQQAYPEDGKKKFGHGAEPMTSMFLRYLPGSVDLSLGEPFSGKKTMQGIPVQGVSAINLAGTEVMMPLNIDEVNEQGMTGGDPSEASADKGKIFEDHLVQQASLFIQTYWKAN